MVGFIKEKLFRGYHQLRASWPVWFYVLNREARAVWRREGRRPEVPVNPITDALERDGVAFARIEDFDRDGAFFRAMTRFTRDRLDRPEIQEKIRLRRSLLMSGTAGPDRAPDGEKRFLAVLWNRASDPFLDFENPFLRFSLDGGVLCAAGRYLGLAPKLNVLNLMVSLPLPEGASEIASQRWHRDPEDKKMVKMFVYLTDVNDLGAGPFIYVKGSHRGGKWGQLFPQIPPHGRYPEPEALERVVPQEDIVTCFGKAGTIIFCDTSGLHKGGYCVTEERIMFTAGFVSKASLAQTPYTFPPQGVPPSLSALARYALEV